MTNLKVFQDKKELLKSLPALTASDFIIYDTSEQDETKPYVLVSFSFYNEKVGSYTYEVRTNNTLGVFIKEVRRTSGSSGNTGFYMYDVRTHYYDAELGEWVFYETNTRTKGIASFLGLKGSLNTIVYATRDVYYSSSTMRPKDSRFLLSGRFRNENPFDEFFQEEHLTQLGYEDGDDILRVKYADDNHLLFVIKDSTSPLKAIYSSTYYYNLTISGTLNGLQYNGGNYTEVSSLQHVASQTLPFDDYVLYSTLDITFQDRLMRMKDYYVVGTRDEIISVLPESIQIEEPFEFEVQTNPTGLAVNTLIELPEVYDTVGVEVAQFQAGNSYPYEHYFENVDLIEKWDKFPLPPKQTVANFYDGNNCRIVYQSGENECKMLTFTMEEDCQVYLGSTSHGYWYFSDRTKASNFMFYSLTKEGIGEGTSVTWNSSTTSLLSSTTKLYKRDVDCIFFSSVPVYDADQTTVLFEAMSYTDLAPYYFHFKSVGFDPSVRIRVGETWEERLQINCDKSESTTIKSITFSGDYQPTYDKKGTYCLTAHIVVDQFKDDVYSSNFLLNVYDETCLSYPNNIPFPVEDGMKDFLIFKGKAQIGLVSHTGTEGICPYVANSASIRWFDNHPDGGYGSTCGTYLYYLNEETKVWEFQSGSESRPYQYPLFNPAIVNGVEDVVYSNMDIYDSTKTNIVYSKSEYQKQDYHISMRNYPVPYELPDVNPLLEADGAIHYFIAYRGGDIYLTTLTPANSDNFSLIQLGATSSSAATISPSGTMTSVSYRKYLTSTGAWGPKVTYSNTSKFISSYVDTGVSSTLNKALTTNDMVIYTTLPIYLKRSVGNQQTLLRYEDNRLIADENSIPPKVLAIRPTVEAPYTVDTAFDFEYDFELESIEGIMLKNFEWDNKISYFPAGENMIRLRIQDNRDLWSDWFEYSFTVERPIIPDNVPIGEYPMKPDGAPYQHYMIYRANNQTGYAYFCFDLKEGIEDPRLSYLKNGSDHIFRSELGMADQVLAEYAIYQSFTDGVWGGQGTLYSSTSSGGYFQCERPKLYNELRSSIYYTTVPIYMYRSDEIFAYPSEPPKFPLSLAVAASHENVWTSDDVTVTTKIHTNGQSWHDFKYRINNGDFIPLESDGDLIFSETGEYHLEFFIYNQDNVETKAEVFFKIDKENPVLSIGESDNYFIFNATDNHSGIGQLFYRLAEEDVFTRSKNFGNHLAVALDNHTITEPRANDWIPIQSGFKLTKPIYGGVYVYELMAVDNVGNTHLIQHIYDLPKIPITSIKITPEDISLAYNKTEQLTVEVLPSNHNEAYTISYESLSPYVSVSSSGVVKNINGYFNGVATVRVYVNRLMVDVPINCVLNFISYPSNLPSLYDLHHYTKDYSDFIIARTSSSETYNLFCINREDNEAIYYINPSSSSTYGNHYLAYSIPNSVISAKRFNKYDEAKWQREGYDVSLGETQFADNPFYSKFPNKSIVFSTIDIYSDASGELLVYPKDELPPTSPARVWFEPEDYSSQWVTSSYFTVHGEDMGDGLVRLTYSLNSGKEVEIENGGVVSFPQSGIHTLQAFAYNNHSVQSETEVLNVKLDMDAPTLEVEKVYNEETLCYDIYLLMNDELSTIHHLNYRKNGFELDDLYFEGDTSVRLKVDTHPISDYGRFDYDFYVEDVAGNRGYVHYLLEVEKPTPTNITVVPASINIREGEVVELSVEVDVIGHLEEGEILLSGYDESIVDVEGFTVTGLMTGFTSIIVSCRGVSTTVPVNIRPAFIPVETLEVRPTEATMEVGEVLRLETIITPHEATDKTLTFAILQGDEVVSVDQEGVVVALKQGQAVVSVSTHNGLTQQTQIEVLKPKEAPIVQNLRIAPASPYVGQEVVFTYDVILDTERGAELVEERWTNKQSTYSTTGLHTVGLEVLDSNGLWSEKVELTFEVRPTSNIRVKTGKTFTTLARSNKESVVRVKTDEGWVSLLTTSETSPVRVKVGGAWINIQIEK